MGYSKAGQAIIHCVKIFHLGGRMIFGPLTVMALEKEMRARYVILRLLLIEEKLERIGREDLLERLRNIDKISILKLGKVVKILDKYPSNDIENIKNYF
ncbi:MAG: hypothetical protein DRJ32_04120 [Thermoprotei archaeon]|nr:MAG: hypothetical protein DRJ32_04120 [Thermoprotei archaeon]